MTVDAAAINCNRGINFHKIGCSAHHPSHAILRSCWNTCCRCSLNMAPMPAQGPRILLWWTSWSCMRTSGATSSNLPRTLRSHFAPSSESKIAWPSSKTSAAGNSQNRFCFSSQPIWIQAIIDNGRNPIIPIILQLVKIPFPGSKRMIVVKPSTKKVSLKVSRKDVELLCILHRHPPGETVKVQALRANYQVQTYSLRHMHPGTDQLSRNPLFMEKFRDTLQTHNATLQPRLDPPRSLLQCAFLTSANRNGEWDQERSPLRLLFRKCNQTAWI